MRTFIRSLDPKNPNEIDLVALRMRDTLVEGLGQERGESMYSMDWLRERVKHHLDEKLCVGEVLLICSSPNDILGHCILRLEPANHHSYDGLFSTIYVQTSHRRLGLAALLVKAGEEWFRAKGIRKFCTHTSRTNYPLIKLFERQGYQISFEDLQKEMVELSKDEEV